MNEPPAREDRGAHPPDPEEGRYARQLSVFREAKVDPRAVLRRWTGARVLVVGAGAVGSYLIEGLASAGVGEMRIHDPTAITEDEVRDSALLGGQDIGSPRARALGAYVSRRHPRLTCRDAPAEALLEETLAGTLAEVDCVVVAADAPLPAVVEVVNEAALRADRRWLVGQMDGGVGLIGPTVIPHQSACYRCYELRRDVNLADYAGALQREARLRELPGVGRVFEAPRAFAAAIGGLLALEALRLLSRAARPQTVGRVLRLDFFAPEMTYHRILRFPSCPACGGRARSPLPAAARRKVEG